MVGLVGRNDPIFATKKKDDGRYDGAALHYEPDPGLERRLRIAREEEAERERQRDAAIDRQYEEEKGRTAERFPADGEMEKRALELMRQDDTRGFFEHVRKCYRRGDGDLVGHWKARGRLFGDTHAGMSPLHVACKNGASRIAAAMASTYRGDYGSLYCLNAESLTPIEVATPEVAQALATSENVCSVLVDVGNDKKGLSKKGALAMVTAAVRARPKLLCGKDGYNWGSEPAHVAAEYKVEGVMLPFVEAGGKGLMARHNGGGNAPLHVAVRGGHACIVYELLRLGDDPNRRTSGGDTPLHVAAASGDVGEVIRGLLSAGADEKLKNKAGKTPVQVCSSPSTKNAFKTYGTGSSGCSCVVS
eukprot:Rhum_TRINITY_DN10978_c0_g1::Rhum_TRINITY_DN10978_c0_g1_i1::g.41597::m.41597